MAVTAVHGQIRIADIDRVRVLDHAKHGTLIVVLSTDLMLQQDMAETAVFGQHHSVFAHMLAVMAAETTRSMPMAPVVREISPAHLHYWIIISLVTSLKRRNCVLDGSLPLLCN